MKPTWEKPRTSRVYLQAPFASHIVMLQPDFKLTYLDLNMQSGRHTRQNGCGVHLLFGKQHPDALDFHTTVYDTPRGGIPVFTVRNTDPENGCAVSMTAFTDSAQIPLAYVRVTVTNNENEYKTGSVGLLPRAVHNDDQYLTGLWDTGYESYEPNLNQWYLQQNRPVLCTGEKTAEGADGYAALKILSNKGFTVHWVSREDQPKRFEAHNYFACDYTVEPGETKSVDFVFCAKMPEAPKSYDEALKGAVAYWQGYQERITLLPDTDNARLIDMFRLNVTQCMQMLARYEDDNGLIVRQGDVGRYVWVWEGIHVLMALDHVGFTDMTTDAYRNYISWVGTGDDGRERGKICYKHVFWDNSEGALLMGLAVHLLHKKDTALFEEFKPTMMNLLDHIESKRHADTSSDIFYGLYPNGQASDWGEIGRHWTFTDSFIVMGLTHVVECMKFFDAPEYERVRGIYDDYHACCVRTMEYLYKGHENDTEFMLPHIAGISFESSYNHCFYTDGAPLLPVYGIMDPNSRIFEQMESFFRKNGLVEHGLWGRVTNATDPGVGVYGDCYYTGIPEIMWSYAWMARKEWDKVDEAFNAIMRYNITTEYIVSERYCSYDPWYTPWQPNGSGSARIVLYMLDYCKSLKNR